MISQDIEVDPSDTTFSIIGGSVDISMIVKGQTIQTYRATFPSVGGMPLPQVNPAPLNTASADYNSTGSTVPWYPWWHARMNSANGPFVGDFLKSIELSHGDARLALMADTTVQPFDKFEALADYPSTTNFSHCLRAHAGQGPQLLVGGTSPGTYVNLPMNEKLVTPVAGTTVKVTLHPDILPTITDLRASGWSGDFDNGIGDFPDGPFLNKSDEGTYTPNLGISTPYTDFKWTVADGLFSPLRQIPSAVMFGSLPTGVKAGIPWRTLLFCPNPADPGHVGFQNPPDHLLLDLFRMPVVEPLAISGPASTDGKINMNYAIAPFNYIRRASSLYAVLDTLKFLAIPDSQSSKYKSYKLDPRSTIDMRNRVDIPKTLAQFDTRFASNDIFRSATEICSLFLVPASQTLANVQNLSTGFWSVNRLTGDNSREKPYAELYPKLTTQSNSYRVHIRVQVLPKSAGLSAGQTDFVPLAEYRGSRLVERYLDPNNPAFNAAVPVDPDTACLNDLYQYRTLEEWQFNP
jgi:uncharacterized protein (TIGR02600 family)